MPAAQAVLLPLCIGLTLVGVLVVLIAGRRGRRGRVVQGLALALAPAALYLTGLLALLWDAVVAVVGWVRGSVFDLTAWIGFGVLALCLVLWVVGGVVARRSPKAAKGAKAVQRGRAGSAPATGRQVVAGRAPATTPPGRQAQQAPAGLRDDDDMAEIEALLKSRGIQ